MVFNQREQDAKKVLDEKIMTLVLAKNLTYIEAKKIIESGQSSLGDFRIR